jgi:F0F1-type ATP synthase membrane subunit b/b'
MTDPMSGAMTGGVNRRWRRAVGAVSALAFTLFFVALPLFAQEEAGPEATPTGWVFRWLNFAIVAVLIVWGFSKAAPYFRKNAEEISQKIAEGTRAREAAERQRDEAKAKLANIPQEVEAIRAEAKRGMQIEGERLRALAKSEAQTIERAGHAEIAAAERAARIELKLLAAHLAVERAEAVLRRDLTEDNEAALFRTFVAELGANGTAN